MFRYKIDVAKELSSKGYTTARIRKEKLISEASMTSIRNGGNITLNTLNTICLMLRKQASDIIEIVPTDEEKIKFF